MTASQNLTGASSAQSPTWEAIDWSSVEESVHRLQMRIAKAMREGKRGKVKALQWLLARSFHAKLLAVKRVTQNRGAKTPGTDGVIWNTAKKKMTTALNLKRRGYRPQPLRSVSRRDKVNIISYADDFVVTGGTREVLEDKVKPVVIAFLKERGLELSATKTKITHINDGFDFLGFSIRKYNGKLLIKPAKTSVKSFLNEPELSLKRTLRHRLRF